MTDGGRTARGLLAPFAARIVRPEWADRVVAGAYDSKTPEQRRRILETNPYSYFGVTRSATDAEPGTNPSADDLLASGAATLTRILAADAFAPSTDPALHAYRLTSGGHHQTGVVGALDLDGFSDGRVFTHENVGPERAELLGRHLRVVGAASSPISLTQPADTELAAIVERAATATAVLDHVVEDVRHEVWPLPPDATDAVSALVGRHGLWVTDGHHRSAAALAARSARPHDPVFARALAVVFPADQLRVEAFHRRAPDRDHRHRDALVEALGTVGAVVEVPDADTARPTGPGQIGVYLDGAWFRLVLDPVERPGPLAGLDVERLRRDVLGHVLGVDELAADGSVDHVPDPTGVAELVRRCDDDGRIGFVLHPTTVGDLMAVARAGDLMPPKSSYFAPKPRSGIFLRTMGTGATAAMPGS